MFNWLGNLFPYSDLHSLNLDWILSKMKETAAQAAKAVADAANALAQVAEAKAAALSAQTAAQNAQTAANNAQTAANNAADSAENAVNVAQAAKSTAQAAQTTAQTAQSAAQTAQSAAQTATAEVNELKAKFPIKSSDIASQAVGPIKLSTRQAYLFNSDQSVSSINFPADGSATREELSTGVVNPAADRFLDELNSKYLQLFMEIRENGEITPSTVFSCSAPIVTYTNKSTAGLVTIGQIIVIKNETNEMYNGFIKITKINQSGNLVPKCEMFFETEPPFNVNTRFIISVRPVLAFIAYDP